MKWLLVLLLAVVIFGGAALFSYKIFFQQEMALRAEQHSTATPVPTPDFGAKEYVAAAALKDEGKLLEARTALLAFLQRYPRSGHAGDAMDLLGEINITVLLSRIPTPDKTEYVVKKGDVLARVAQKTKSTTELIMRMNNMDGTMLRIGERLLISHPEFTLLVQREQHAVILLNKGVFFKRYHIAEEKLPARQPPKITTRVAEVMAWKDGKRIGIGSKDYAESTRWVRLGAAGYTLYSISDLAHSEKNVEAPPVGLGLAASDLIEMSALVNSKTPVTITD